MLHWCGYHIVVFFGTVIKLLSKDYNNFYLSGTEMRLAANLGFRSSLRIELFCRKSHQMYFMYSWSNRLMNQLVTGTDFDNYRLKMTRLFDRILPIITGYHGRCVSAKSWPRYPKFPLFTVLKERGNYGTF